MNAERKIDLPGVLGEIADAAGEDAALKIAHERGGTRVYFPPDPAADHWLSRLIGAEAARRVCDRLTCGVGPLNVDLPLGPAGHAARVRAKVDAMIAEGCSERDIVRATGYSIRGVRYRKARSEAKKDDRQLPLI